FDFVVLDPPWPNKSVHRSGHYESQDIYDLFKIPLSSLLRSDNSDNPALVAVWITNKPKFKRFVTDKLFPSWGLETVAEWHWLKVTTEGEPVMPLDSPHRKPYEQLVIGRCKQRPSPDIPQTRVIVSVPCKHHSRKPPLREIMKPYLGSEPRCVELFARCLLPGWTSWGNECLKFQN
ncbi:MT-A70-like protein, partial [Radiomyces spectabilis]|uniref:MT-A70-like protein n=1 Tax=Radiomyces spectabilis TaxID=64574 RepID=UPI00222122E5